MSVRLGNERLSQMNYGTISPQPIDVHVAHLLWVFVHAPDGGPPPRDGRLATVFVGDGECLLGAKPTLVGGEELKVPLDVIHDCVLCVFDVGFDIVDVEL